MFNNGKNILSSSFSNDTSPDGYSNFSPEPAAQSALIDVDSAAPAAFGSGVPSGGHSDAGHDVGAITSFARAGGSGGTTSGSGGTTTTLTSQATASPFVINIVWDSTIANAPAGYTAAIQAAAQYLESQFVDPVTINIQVGYGAVAGSALPSGAIGSSGSNHTLVSYASLLAALKADSKTATDASVLASMPSTNPVGGYIWLANSEAKALGLLAGNATGVDGYAAFTSTLPLSYTDTNGVASGTYDLYATALHELTEVMGRTMFDGSNSDYNLYDYLHYSAAGVRDFSAGTAGYFSPDGGVTNDGTLNTNGGGDASDWASSMGNDMADAFMSSGTVYSMSANDLTLMDALGWDPTGSVAPPPPPTAPTGVSATALSNTIARALTTASPIAKFAEVGGTSGDNFSYTLGGSGAASFTLTSSGNTAQLASTASGLAGSSSGTLYALTVTANDLTAGLSSPASAVDVIVGGAGSDTISATSVLAGQSPATPTFIYGQGASDTLDGSGMTGNLWFIGGGGADKMTGGSGVNDFLYGAVGDSTPSAMDIISNFHTATDTIDLTGIGSTLSYVGAIKNSGKGANTLAAHAVGYQVSSGNTYIYVNTSGSSESISATNMKLDLVGSLTLSSSNILHQ